MLYRDELNFIYTIFERDVPNIGGIMNLWSKKHSPPGTLPEGLFCQIARTTILPPEIKEGLIHHHNLTSQFLLLFLFGFLFGLFLSCHKYLLLDFHGWVKHVGETMNDSGEEMFVSKTLPYFVGAAIIMTQLIVCQEKNTIL